jgi:crossover junction endodeoxyribonuclease RusA
MKVTLGYPPSLNNLYATVRGRRVLSREGRAYKAASALRAKVARLRKLEGPVEVLVGVYRPRRRGDLDNVLKAVLDALKGIAWNDDEQVVRIVATRWEDRDNPRVELVIDEVAEMPF